MANTFSIIFFVLILISCSCRNNNDNNTGIEIFSEAISFNIHEVKHIHLEGVELIDLSPPMDIYKLYVYDSLLIILGRSAGNDYSAHIYNPRNGNLVRSFA